MTFVSPEILRIRQERTTCYMKIPVTFLYDRGLKKGDYLVCRPMADGGMSVHKWEDPKDGKG